MWRRGSAESDGGEMNELNKCKSDRVKTTKNVEPQMRAATKRRAITNKEGEGGEASAVRDERIVRGVAKEREKVE